MNIFFPIGLVLVASSVTPRQADFQRIALKSSSQENKLKKQGHMKATLSLPALTEIPADPLMCFTQTPIKVSHPKLTVNDIYDANRLFVEDMLIGKNGRVKFLAGKHDPNIFRDLTFHHYKLLIYYFANKTSAPLDGWDLERTYELARHFTSKDLTVIGQNIDGCYFLGLIFKYLRRAAIVKADISERCMLDMLCMLTPTPHTLQHNYDLEFLMKRFTVEWLQKYRQVICHKLEYPVLFSGNVRASIVGYPKDSTFAENFFIHSGIIEEGKRPFGPKLFKFHSKHFIRYLVPRRLEQFLKWALSIRSNNVLSDLNRDDLKHLASSKELCLILSPYISMVPLVDLPFDMKEENVTALFSKMSWNDASEVFSKLNQFWIYRHRKTLIPFMFDHYPRSAHMSASSNKFPKLIELTQPEAEDLLITQSIIIDGVAPFIPEQFGKRSRGLLGRVSRKAISNIAKWAMLGDINRAAKIIETFTADDLKRFERLKIIHVFDQVLPLMNIEAVVNADLLTDTMVQMLNSIETSKFGWDVLSKFDRSFFENQSYAYALIRVLCNHLAFTKIPYGVVTLLREIYGDGIPRRMSGWIGLVNKVIIEEQSERIRLTIDQIGSLSKKSDIDKIEAKKKVIQAREEELNAICFEYELTVMTRSGISISEIEQAKKQYVSAVDDLIAIYRFVIRHPH